MGLEEEDVNEIRKELRDIGWHAEYENHIAVGEFQKKWNLFPLTGNPKGETAVDWYTSLGIIQTTTCDEPPATVRVDVALAYKKDDKATSTEITQRTVELKAFLRRYFSGKTAAELRNTNNEDALENEIKNGINDKILSSSRIRDVVFQQKDVIEQN